MNKCYSFHIVPGNLFINVKHLRKCGYSGTGTIRKKKLNPLGMDITWAYKEGGHSEVSVNSISLVNGSVKLEVE